MSSSLPPPGGGTPSRSSRPPDNDAATSKRHRRNNEQDEGEDQHMLDNRPLDAGNTSRSTDPLQSPIKLSVKSPLPYEASEVARLKKELAEANKRAEEATKKNEELSARVKQLEEALGKVGNLDEIIGQKIAGNLDEVIAKKVTEILKKRRSEEEEERIQKNSPSTSNSSLHPSEFPPLSNSSTPPAQRPPSYREVAERAPKTKKLLLSEWNLFHTPPLALRPPPPLPSLDAPEEELLRAVDRFYIDNVQPAPISEIKATFRKRGIGLQHILSLDFVGSRLRLGEKRYVLEVTCYAPASSLIQRDLFNRLGIKILRDFDPSQATNPSAGEDIKKMVRQRYQDRMLRHANRKEDKLVGRRRLFGVYFVQAGGDKTKLDKIEVTEGSGDVPMEEEEESRQVQEELVASN